ncbi:MAG: PKD domain-containing protein, partial [Bacteroidetes bacterium]|nr:PKD domain-containing protein [Bacteroidota bacterium]
AIDAPSPGCGLTATESVTVRVYNFGTVVQSNIPVSFDDGTGVISETIAGPLNSFDTISYTFTTATSNLSTFGTYFFDAWTSLAADTNNANDSITNYIITNDTVMSSFPYIEDFETEPLCGTPCGTSCPLAGNWTNAGGDDIDWTVDAGGTPSAGTGPTVDHTLGTIAGKYLYTEASCLNIGYPNKTAILLSACIDISSLTAPRLEFWYHMFGANMGTLYVDVYSGGVWTTVDSLIGQQQTAQTDPWLKALVNLSSFSGVIKIRFRGITGLAFDSDMAIDDIRIFNIFPNDVGVIAIDAPASGCGLTASETVTVKVLNFGTNTQSGIPVSFDDGTGVITETIAGPLLSGDTITYTFTATSNLSVSGTYFFDVWTGLAGDADNTNDSITNYLIENTAVTTFPYLEDFEAEPLCGTGCGDPCPLTGNWTNSLSDDNDWTVDEGGTPSNNTGPDADHTLGTPSGNYLYTEANGGCNPSSEAILVSPCFDIGALTNPTLSFWYHMFGSGMGDLYVDIFSGGIWTAVDSIQGQQQADDLDPWLKATIDISLFGPFINVRFRGITGANFRSDMAIDDIEITSQALPNDAGVIAVDTPASGCDLTAAESVTIRVKNFGVDPQDTIPVAYSINGSPAVNDTIFAAVLSGDTITFTFAVTADLSAPDSLYIFDAWTSLLSDTNNINDSTLNVSVTHFSYPNVNLGADTILCGDSLILDAGNTGAIFSWSTTESTQTIIVDTTGTYWVDVTISGCTTRDSIDVTINPIPLADFSSNAPVCYGNLVVFTDLSTVSSGSITSWFWDFGDANVDFIQNPSHIYLSAGAYNVQLVVTTDNGCVDTTQQSVTVNPVPVAGFSFTTECEGSLTQFTDTSSISSGSITSWFWNFGDAATSILQNPPHLYASAGTYNVQLVIASNNGCQDVISNSVTVNPLPTANITANGSITFCSGDSVELVSDTAITYDWLQNSVSTGVISINYFASAAADYQVVVTNAFGCTDTSAVETVAISIPVISVTPDPGVICVAGVDSVTLTASGAVSYSWAPAVGLSSTSGTSVNASPPNDTVYTVIGTDSIGCTDTTTVLVQQSVSNPVAIFTAADTIGCGGLTVTFNNTSTDAITYSWALPGGTTADTTVQNPVVTYSSVGTYNVTLTAYGCAADSTVILVGYITVTTAPIANITALDSTSFCEGDSVTLVSDFANTYNWLLNGVPTGVNSITYIATVGGDYQVVVSSAGGCSDTSVIVTVIVSPVVTGELFANDSGAVVIVNGGTGGFTYLWTPGGFTTDQISGVAPGTYTVTVTDAIGCTWTGSIFVGPTGLNELTNENSNITLYPNPAIDILNIETKGTNMLSITMINALGQVVSTITPHDNSVQISTAEYVNGFYFILVETNDGLIRRKISVNK